MPPQMNDQQTLFHEVDVHASGRPLRVERAEGPYLFTDDGHKILDAASGAVVVNIGQGREEIASSPPSSPPAQLYPAGMDLAGAREAGGSAGAMDAAGAQSLLLHQRRLGSGRGRAQVRDALSLRLKGKPVEEENSSRASSPITATRLAALSASSSLAPRRLRARAVRLAQDSAFVLLSMSLGQDLSGAAISIAPRRWRRKSSKPAPTTSRRLSPSRWSARAAARSRRSRSTGRRSREICDRNDILLIADEVMTGFGRTGKRFAVEHWNVKPDILVGGKGLTGGYMPMGMIAVDENSSRNARKRNGDFMFYTYSAHPLACAIAERVLAIMEREKLVERAAEIGARLGGQLQEELSGHPLVGDIRGTACSGASSWCAIANVASPSPAEATSRPACSARRSARTVLLSFDRDGGSSRRRRDHDHAAVHRQRQRHRFHREHGARRARRCRNRICPEPELRWRDESGMAESIIGPTSHYFFSQRLKLHYVDWGNPAAPLMILVHGGRDHCRNWDWTALDLRSIIT